MIVRNCMRNMYYVPVIMSLSRVAVVGALLYKMMACTGNLESIFSCHSTSLISWKIFEVLTSDSYASLTPSEYISWHTKELLSWNNSNFSVNIIFQFLQRILIFHINLYLPVSVSFSVPTNNNHADSDLEMEEATVCELFLLFLKKIRTIWFCVHSLHTRLLT
jgi:hypothetical protein